MKFVVSTEKQPCWILLVSDVFWSEGNEQNHLQIEGTLLSRQQQTPHPAMHKLLFMYLVAKAIMTHEMRSFLNLFRKGKTWAIADRMGS